MYRKTTLYHILFVFSKNLCVVVSAGLHAGVPGLLLGIRDGFQVSRDGGTSEVKAMNSILWEDQDVNPL